MNAHLGPWTLAPLKNSLLSVVLLVALAAPAFCQHATSGGWQLLVNGRAVLHMSTGRFDFAPPLSSSNKRHDSSGNGCSIKSPAGIAGMSGAGAAVASNDLCSASKPPHPYEAIAADLDRIVTVTYTSPDDPPPRLT